MKTFRNIVAVALIVLGLLFLFGAAGESDMYNRAGDFLPLAVTLEKVGTGIGLLLLGMFIKSRR